MTAVRIALLIPFLVTKGAYNSWFWYRCGTEWGSPAYKLQIQARRATSATNRSVQTLVTPGLWFKDGNAPAALAARTRSRSAARWAHMRARAVSTGTALASRPSKLR